MPDITQIAAVHWKTGFKFSTYVKTTVPISSEAQKVIGNSVDDHGIMRVNGGSVDSVSIKTSLHDCMMWFAKFPRAIFVAHNGRRFDFPVFVIALLNTHCLETQTGSERVLQATCNAHSAPDDVEALGSLLKTCKITENIAYIFTVTAIHKSVCLSHEKP
ncbi:hypothetical protein DPMN_126322 [Dreissena polymorpha]|uniref:Uncharacterized protein n=1 Tax=Dreissena polymorpha TaxID=45954 RepID=A0A9D4GWU4_DREPO|nr:hypothetical protein DPMN_126322 [Dreissena polymorpha]